MATTLPTTDISFSSINLAVGNGSTDQLSINDENFRALSNSESGAVTIGDARGDSLNVFVNQSHSSTSGQIVKTIKINSYTYANMVFVPVSAYASSRQLEIVYRDGIVKTTPVTFYQESAPAGLAIDSSGNIYHIGYGGADNAIIKWDSSGTLQWNKKIPGNNTPQNLTVDNSGNVYTCTGGVGYTSENGEVIKLDSSGNHTWRWGQSGRGVLTGTRMFCQDIELSPDQNSVYTAGFWTYNVSSYSLNRPAVAKLNSSGVLQWLKYYDNGDGAYGAMTADSSGNIYALGSNQIYTSLLTKMDSTGAVLWSVTLSAGNALSTTDIILSATDVATDDTAVYVLQYFFRDPGGSGNGRYAIAVNRILADGTLSYSRVYETSDSNLFPKSIVISGSNMIITGNIGQKLISGFYQGPDIPFTLSIPKNGVYGWTNPISFTGGGWTHSVSAVTVSTINAFKSTPTFSDATITSTVLTDAQLATSNSAMTVGSTSWVFTRSRTPL